MGEIGSYSEYDFRRSNYLQSRADLLSSLGPQNPEEMKVALDLVRENLRQDLCDLVDFRSHQGVQVSAELFHSSASQVFEGIQPGDRVLLVPGKHNKDGLGVGVYFNENPKAIPFYIKRARKKRNNQQSGGVVFVLEESGVEGIESFVTFTERQGPAKHSGSAFVEINVQDIKIKESGIKPNDPIKYIYGSGRRIPATKKDIRGVRRQLCLQSGY